jgi:hypothetical protein
VNVAVVYTAVTHGTRTSEFISRFVATWMENPPGSPCDLWVACNGGPLFSEQVLMFSPMSARMFPRVNTPGWDLDGFFDAARGPCSSYDMILCLGESVYFHREGWLKRLVDTRQKYGPGFYGPFGSFNVRPHLQTSAFFCPPVLLLQYPVRPKNRAERMAFEHSDRAMWCRVAERAMPVRMVTFDGDWEPRLWRYPNDILWRGTQQNLLMMNNHAQAWENASPLVKFQWSNKADGIQ